MEGSVKKIIVHSITVCSAYLDNVGHVGSRLVLEAELEGLYGMETC